MLATSIYFNFIYQQTLIHIFYKVNSEFCFCRKPFVPTKLKKSRCDEMASKIIVETMVWFLLYNLLQDAQHVLMGTNLNFIKFLLASNSQSVAFYFTITPLHLEEIYFPRVFPNRNPLDNTSLPILCNSILPPLRIAIYMRVLWLRWREERAQSWHAGSVHGVCVVRFAYTRTPAIQLEHAPRWGIF